MWRFVLVLVALGATLSTACGGDSDKPAPSGTPGAQASATAKPSPDDKDLRAHEAELKETAIAFAKGIFTDGAVKSYGYFASDFKERCPLDDFVAVLAIAKVFLGDLKDEDIDVQISGVRYEDGKAFVDSTATINGDDFDDGADDGEDYWVREDGAWKISNDDPHPCDTSGATSSSDDKTPAATGPGTSRAEAVALGTSVTGKDAKVTVLNVDLDAEDIIAAASDFPETPVAGRRYVLVNVRVEAIGSGEETIDLGTSNFSMTGSGNKVYEVYGDDTSCGFDVPDELDAKLFPGGVAEGNVCIQVPQNESDLILIFEPQFSFDNEDRRYLALE